MRKFTFKGAAGGEEKSKASAGGEKWFLNRASKLNAQIEECTKQLVEVVECNKRVKVCSLQACFARDEHGRFWLTDAPSIDTVRATLGR